jgi:hypothetical protein
MRIELPIINEPNTGLCTIADLTGSGEMSKILISTYCRNIYISSELYNRLEHEKPQSRLKTEADGAAFYLNDLKDASAGVIKSLRLPGHTLSDVPVIVTPSFPAYRCDMILGLPAISANKRYVIDNEKGFVIVSDEQ